MITRVGDGRVSSQSTSHISYHKETTTKERHAESMCSINAP